MTFTREVFPVFFRWRYATIKSRELIGQSCLKLFHTVLNLLGRDDSATSATSRRLTLRDVTVYSLLFTESGRTLLDIISTGVENVDAALAAQGG